MPAVEIVLAVAFIVAAFVFAAHNSEARTRVSRWVHTMKTRRRNEIMRDLAAKKRRR